MPNPSTLQLKFDARKRRLSMGCSLALLPMMWAGAVGAQQSPGGFQLPTPTPTPTAAPQGPVDVRSGVPIGPRAIPDQPTPTPTPTPAPAPAPTATPTPSPRATEAPSTTGDGSETPRAGSTSPTSRPSATRPSGAPASTLPSPATGTGQTSADDATEGSEQIELPTATSEASDASAAANTETSSSETSDTSDNQSGPSFFESFDFAQHWPWIGAAGGLLALLLAGWMWRRRRAAAAPLRIEPPKGNNIEETAEATASPAQDSLKLTLDITSATRSFMMFTVNFRVTFSNRSDHAVRDLALSAQLASAGRGETNTPPVGAAQPVGTIERIGPHQSRSITGQLQMPMSQVQPLRQGTKPLLVPLLHLTLEGAGQSVSSRSYVMGLPSATAKGRVHPIPLDVPPGGLPDLKVREIAVSDSSTRAEPEVA